MSIGGIVGAAVAELKFIVFTISVEQSVKIFSEHLHEPIHRNTHSARDRASVVTNIISVLINTKNKRYTAREKSITQYFFVQKRNTNA